MSPRALLFLRRAARVLLVLTALLPFVPALVVGVPGLAAFGALLDAWFGFQCERAPARMLVVGSVCARCVGLYVGLGTGALLARPEVSPRGLRLWIGLGALLLALDVVSEMLDLRPAWALFRVMTGVAFAYPVGVSAALALRAPAARHAPVAGPERT